MDENYRNTNGKWKSIRADAAGNGKKFFLPSWNERWNNLGGIIYNCCLEISKVSMHVLIWFWETFVNLQMLSGKAFVREWITFEQCFPKRVLGLTSGAWRIPGMAVCPTRHDIRRWGLGSNINVFNICLHEILKNLAFSSILNLFKFWERVSSTSTLENFLKKMDTNEKFLKKKLETKVFEKKLMRSILNYFQIFNWIWDQRWKIHYKTMFYPKTNCQTELCESHMYMFCKCFTISKAQHQRKSMQIPWPQTIKTRKIHPIRWQATSTAHRSHIPAPH